MEGEELCAKTPVLGKDTSSTLRFQIGLLSKCERLCLTKFMQGIKVETRDIWFIYNLLKQILGYWLDGD